jgi:hypothetical protein
MASSGLASSGADCASKTPGTPASCGCSNTFSLRIRKEDYQECFKDSPAASWNGEKAGEDVGDNSLITVAVPNRVWTAAATLRLELLERVVERGDTS